ncbi:unnamed protein product [Rhizoctonia solani]|uniref:Inhibitor I9 domain-containing protein n=1 Tax=Rhizoctonia solani TaxID=456999 RepID=A0A8H3GF60_9AGAM|nr:unnamed protein product [Rhizoctonia solani]
MCLKSLILLLSVAFSGVIAAPAGSKIPILKHSGKIKENSYIIQLKPEASRSTHLSRLPASGLDLSYTYDQVFHGYAARLDSIALEYVRQSNDVAAIFEDGIIITDTYVAPSKSDSTGPLSRSNPNLEDIRRVNAASVDVYDIGTYGSADGNGISTCLAGIAVGATYGVATQANVYAVKAISDSGAAATSDLIAGAGGSANTALDAAVVSATNKGIHFIVPAPASNIDIGTISPARVASAVTVGVAGQSYTSGVDVCSKGTAVTCPSIQGPAATRTISGSSAAMARVAGIVAAVLGTYGNSSPASMEATLKDHASNTSGCLVINNPW